MSELTRLEAAEDPHRIGISYSIVQSVSSVPYQRFVASLKTLFSDFVVREQSALVDEGKPLRLTTFNVPRDDKRQVNRAHGKDDGSAMADDEQLPEDMVATITTTFTPLVGEKDTSKLLELATQTQRVPSSGLSLMLEPIADKAARSEVHKQIKVIFGNQLVSEATDGRIVIRQATQALLREQDRRSRAALPVPYLHFTLYKENLDSNSALRMMAQQLGIHAKTLMFSGTKDKRGVTLQRVACRGLDAQKAVRLNRGNFGRNATIKVGNFESRQVGLSLGDLRGNYFEIVLRCSQQQQESTKIDTVALEAAATTLQRVGFVNYFGPQRFGTTSVLTSDVGRAMLRGAYRDAVMLVLRSRCEVSPEARAALELLDTTDDATAALNLIPHYCFTERDLVKHLVRSPGDYRGCFTCIPRTTAMLYFHSVQSLVWNKMVSLRLQAHGPVPIVGDLVAVEGTQQLDGEMDDDDVPQTDAEKKKTLIPVRCLTEADISSAKFTISDVLMTVPGCDPLLVFPTCDCANKTAYESIVQELQCAELFTDPHDVAKLYHFHGTYRRLVVIPTDMSLEVRTVASFRTPVLETDLQVIYKGFKAQAESRKRPREEETVADTAVIPAVSASEDCVQEQCDEGASEEAVSTTNADATEPQVEVEAISTTEKLAETTPAPSTPCTAVIVRFGLPSGAYATSLIRELCVTVKE